MIVCFNLFVRNNTDETIDYRVWVDHDLITERMFEPKRFGNRQFTIHENLVLELAPGEHTIRIEQVDYPEPHPPESIAIHSLSISGIEIPEAVGKTSFLFYL